MKKIEKLESGICGLFTYKSMMDFITVARQSGWGRDDRDNWAFGELKSREKTEEYLIKGLGLKSMRTQARKYREEFENTVLEEIRSSVQNIKRTRRNNDSDGDLDLDAVLGGSDEYWTKIERNGSQKVVRIAINCSISCQNGSREFAKLVSLSAVFCEILEELGYGVEIYCAFISELTGYRDTPDNIDWESVIFPIKQCNEVLDVERIYSLGLQGLLRDVFFRVERVLSGSHGGRCMTPPNDVLEFSNIDVIVEKTWTDGNQAERIIQAIENL